MSTLTLLILAGVLAALFVWNRHDKSKPDPAIAAAAKKRADDRAALRRYEPVETYKPMHSLDMSAFNVIEITDTCDGRGPLSQSEKDAIEAILKTNTEFTPRDPWGVAK